MCAATEGERSWLVIQIWQLPGRKGPTTDRANPPPNPVPLESDGSQNVAVVLLGIYKFRRLEVNHLFAAKVWHGECLTLGVMAYQFTSASRPHVLCLTRSTLWPLTEKVCISEGGGEKKKWVNIKWKDEHVWQIESTSLQGGRSYCTHDCRWLLAILRKRKKKRKERKEFAICPRPAAADCWLSTLHRAQCIH